MSLPDIWVMTTNVYSHACCNASVNAMVCRQPKAHTFVLKVAVQKSVVVPTAQYTEKKPNRYIREEDGSSD